ncbi:MAG: hypothetical protein EKK45_29855 [Curvibacter sp.]|nr:MAG: hypothetical protein EKK45_29855 [Curvibacter sp.]
MEKAQPNFAAEPGVLGPDAAILPDRGPGYKPKYEPEALRQFVSLDGERLVTDTRRVAKHFGKQHKNVLRSIDLMRASSVEEIAEFWRLNFEPRDFVDERGKSYRAFQMTKDGFLELAMSFTGEPARLVRIRFISAFNALARRLGAFLDGRDHAREQLQIRDAVSRSRGTEGSHLMHQRRREKRHLEAELARLDAPLQLDLILGEVAA